MPNPEKKSYARALAIGTALSALVVVMAQYSVNVIHGSYLAIDHMPAGGIFVFFVLVGIVCAVLRAFSRRLDLASSELLIIYAMMLVTSSIAEMGFGLQFLPLLSGSYYYASPENKWDEMIHPYVNPAFVPHSAEAIRWLFEGAPTGARIPWSAWVQPLAVWFPFIFTLYFVMICLMVILRRQWMESERIVYPLSLLPIEMVKQDERGRRPFFRSKLMWFAFAIPVIISSLKGLNHYYPLVPFIELVRGVGILRNTAFLYFRISFPIIGFAYFINLKVAFGLWVFNLISTILRSVFAITGVTSYETMTGYGAWTPIFKHLGMGAMIVFVLYGLWPARFHLWAVLKTMFTLRRRGDGAHPPSAGGPKLFGTATPQQVEASGTPDGPLPSPSPVTRHPSPDGDAEIMSYRTAGWGFVLGILFMGFWLNCSGMPL
ncbi:MAG: hypothetical protein FJ278_12660, partial [Planctomycetes bacterium]|nr:hypothetical protein [Planctomycetota bacterium]